MFKIAIAILVCISTVALGAADDILKFTRIASVVVSPDGSQVAYVTFAQSKTDKQKWHYILRVTDRHKQSTIIAEADLISGVKWSPDGHRIAYAAKTGKQQTLWVNKVSNHQGLALVNGGQAISGLKWSTDAKQIAFVAANADENLRLYLVSVAKAAKAKPVTLPNVSITQADFDVGFDWAPDGKTIAFAYQPSTKAPDAQKSKIATLDLKTLKTTIVSFCKNHTCQQPLYSPDGKWLAFSTNLTSTNKAKELAENIYFSGHICVLNNSVQMHCLQNTFNKSPELMGWNSSSNGVYVAESYKAEGMKIYELSLNADAPVKLVSATEGFMEPLTVSLNNTHMVFGFGLEFVNQAPEVFLATAQDFKPQQITQLNTVYNKPLGNVVVQHWRSKDGMNIEGLLITPANYDSKRKYPLYVDVHGGPSGAEVKRYLGGCDEYGEWLVPTSCVANILSHGYIILQVNYRGSSGYGQEFRLANFGDLGGGDYQDIMSGVDALIQDGIVDSNKMVIAGWSYGGYMTAWAVSQSHRFKAAIDGDGLTDLISFSGTSDIPNYTSQYLGAYFWDNSALYWQRSPLAFVKNIETPVLILHGAKDIRVPLSQGQELYTALVRLHKPVKMLVTQNQEHVPTTPDTIVQDVKAVDQWLQKHE